ncbi:MAG: transporter substrate-binding domain-containing protein [Acidobacteria bacterium]|nr:transporter substrate-binding domain-containing protein [Acidobacteriota bacterium]
MQTPRFAHALFLLALALLTAGCGEEKEGPDAMAQMKKNKMVRIATDAVNLPFEFGSGTGVQGFDVDIGNEIAKDLGYDPKWVKIPFEKIFDILRNGEAELIISAISITPERKKEFAFSDPYFSSGNTIARRRDKEEIQNLASLARKKVGVQSGSTGAAFMESQKVAANVGIQKYPTLDDALGALNRMEIDAVVGDEPILTYSIYKSFPNLLTIGTRLTDEQYGIVVRKADKELLAKVNNTVARLIKSGEVEALRKKWFQNVIEEVGKQREQLQREEALRKAPKDVVFNFIKTSGTFNMDRLDGFQLVLAGAQSYQSTPILTSGNRGSCKLSGVLPGQYNLSMSIFRLNTTVTIPAVPARLITFDMNIGAGITIVQK